MESFVSLYFYFISGLRVQRRPFRGRGGGRRLDPIARDRGLRAARVRPDRRQRLRGVLQGWRTPLRRGFPCPLIGYAVPQGNTL